MFLAAETVMNAKVKLPKMYREVWVLQKGSRYDFIKILSLFYKITQTDGHI